MLYKNITDSELTVVREKFQTFFDDLVKAGLKNDNGSHAKTKIAMYASKRIGAPLIDTSNAQWEKFFKQVDDLRFDLPGLARHIDSLPVPEPVVEPTPALSAAPVLKFTALDGVLLHDAGVSVQDDVRVPTKYWKSR